MNYVKKVTNRLGLFQEILSIYSVASDEEQFGNFLKNQYQSLGYHAVSDNVGNVIAAGKGTPEVALVSHMDNVGFMVVKKEKDGYYKLNSIGGPQFRDLDDAVCISDGKYIPGLLYREEGSKDVAYFESLHEPPGMVPEPGDLVTYRKFFMNEGDLVVSPFLDDKSSVFVALLIAEILKNKRHNLMFCHTVREEFGSLGSKALPFSFPESIEQVIIMDIVFGDSPMFSADPVVGQGAGICFKDSLTGDRKMIRDLVRHAADRKIPHQLEVVAGGGSDLSNIYWQNGGFKTGYVGAPVKNCHSSREVVSVTDLASCVELLVSYAENLMKPG